jgi:hypothetical protein
MFAEFLDAARTAAVQNLPITIGAGVAFLVLTTMFVRSLNFRRRSTLDEAVLAVPSSTTQPKDEKALNWAPPEQSYADRRGSVRREGTPVRVLLSSPTFRNGVNDGFVVDRSTGGLRILSPVAVAPGSTLQVRAVNAPDTIGFVTVIVRSCRKDGDHFVIGSEFDKTPPWNVLLLFG